MNSTEMAALLGRPLTPTESSNFDLYLDIATQNLEDALCTPLEQVSENRVFDTREGYRTAFVDIFSNLDEVKIDGEVVDPLKYSVRQWDKRNGSWYNSVVFDCKFDCDGEIEITADWGFEATSGESSDLPSDLQVVLARMFDLVGRQTKLNREVNSKKNEDFTITYNHSSITMADTLMESFLKDNAKTLSKYSQCNIGNTQHGRVC